MSKSNIDKYTNEYISYLKQRMKTSFSFKDWYEQTYNEQLEDDQESVSIVEHKFKHEVSDVINEINR